MGFDVGLSLCASRHKGACPRRALGQRPAIRQPSLAAYLPDTRSPTMPAIARQLANIVAIVFGLTAAIAASLLFALDR